MPIILYTLFIAACVPIILAWIGAYYRIKQFGKLDNNHPRIQQSKLEGIGARVQGAQANAWEALIVYAAVILIAHASGVDLRFLTLPAVIFILLRLFHAVFYIANLAWLRSGIFALSMFCCLYIVYVSATFAG